jgi:hypothetical protein
MGGSLTEQELVIALQRSRIAYPNYFVETGTYKADTTLMAAKLFRHVYTFEIMEPLYTMSVNRARQDNVNNISFHLGDSVKLLHTVVPKVKDGAVYFIDAHASGPDSGFNGTPVPLLDELRVILSYKVRPSLFIFDDLRFWKGKAQQAWDWVAVSDNTVLECFIKEGYTINDCWEENDRFWVVAGCT